MLRGYASSRLLLGSVMIALGCSTLGRRPEHAPEPPPPPPVASPDTAAAPDPPPRASTESAELESVVVVLAPEEHTRLMDEARANLERVAELSAEIDAASLGAAGAERLRSLEHLVTSAEEAIASEDAVAAASLSGKARLLAEELTGE